MIVRIVVSIMCFALSGVAIVRPVNAGEFSVTHPDSAGCGELLWRSDHGYIPLPQVSTDVVLDIKGPLINGTISQEFFNPTDNTIEALYIFPMPEGAAVNSMELQVGERRIYSIVQEKAEARQTYEKAKSEGKKAALVEGMRPNLFSISVAGIESGQTVTVKLGYLDQADYSGNSFHLSIPLTYTPRYFPPSLLAGNNEGATSEPGSLQEDAKNIESRFLLPGHPMIPRAAITINLAAGVPLMEVASASHEIIQSGEGGKILVSTLDEFIPADRDFLFSWTPLQSKEPMVALFTEIRPEGRYGLLMVVPGGNHDSGQLGIPTETLFLIDVSGSMGGASIRQARKALQQALTRLGPEDRFNLIAFNNDSRIWKQSFQDTRATNINSAKLWVRSLKAENGTEMHGALLRAMTQFLNATGNNNIISRRIVIITDAAIGNEDQLLRDTANSLGDVRLHVIGIGSSPNRYLVKRLASMGGGLCCFVNESATSGEGMDNFLSTINRPLIGNPELTWEDAQPQQVFPSRISELYAGELFLWSGKFPSEGIISGTFSAHVAGKIMELKLDDRNPSQGSGGAADRWARMKVTDQMARLHSGADLAEVRLEIVATALEFGLVTKFTSRVGVEELVSTDGSYDPINLANGLPHGSTILGVLPRGGTMDPLLRLVGWLTLILGLLVTGIQRRKTSGAKP